MCFLLKIYKGAHNVSGGNPIVKKNKPGRPSVNLEIRELIKRMALENLSWGAPRIYSELLKLGYTNNMIF